MQRLISYFTGGITSRTLETIGAEVETQFVNEENEPISTETSQQMLTQLAKNGWEITDRKGSLITALTDRKNNKIFYELGRHNIEVATAISTPAKVVGIAQQCLDQIYEAGVVAGAKPFFSPILDGNEDLLVIPDERDAVWLQLDGRSALAPLARTSSVQFTISVSSADAINILNRLGRKISLFMEDFPQDRVWKRYIADSAAGYRSDRYGGPLIFESLDDYCQALSRNSIVRGTHLIPFAEISDLNIPLFLRSIWWHFRLKRYGDSLCIEVRPMARRTDDQIEKQLEKTLGIIGA
ncbi:MAG: hypothetical protein Q8L36_01225 [bacterium]|nr:hypothetical protein [bacterium]